MMLRYPEQVRASLFFPTLGGKFAVALTVRLQRESLVRELVLSLAMAGRERDALDELELCGSLIFILPFCLKTQLEQCSYLPSPPYQDNSVLHTYAGLLCLRLALSATDANASQSTQGA
jgi:hypothetical protein